MERWLSERKVKIEGKYAKLLNRSEALRLNIRNWENVFGTIESLQSAILKDL